MNLDVPSTSRKLISAWTIVRESTQLAPIRSQADYEAMRAVADQLVDHIGENSAHPLEALLDVILELLEAWEEDHVNIGKQSPGEMLRYLMKLQNLKQRDLADIVSQGTLSNILNGNRQISKELAKKFAERFGVNVGVFL